MYNTSLFDLKTSIAKRASIWLKPVQFAGSIDRVQSLFFQAGQHNCTVLAYRLVQDISDILKIVLEKGQTTKAGRLVWAFRNIGHTYTADEIVNTMKSLGYDIWEDDHFAGQSDIAYSHDQ